MKKYFTIVISILMLAACAKPDASLDVQVDMPAHVMASPFTSIDVPYSAVSGTGSVSVTFDVSADIPSVVVVPNPARPMEGVVEIGFGRSITEGSTAITLIFSNGYKESRYRIDFEQEDLRYDGPSACRLDASAQKYEIDFMANTQCSIVIPPEAQSWIKLADNEATKAMTSRNVVLDIAENKAYGRSARLFISTDSGAVAYSLDLEQDGVESTMSFVSSIQDQRVPSFTGDNVEGRVYWHPSLDGYVTWTPNLKASYGDGGNHTITVKTLRASTMSIDSLLGISKVDISEF